MSKARIVRKGYEEKSFTSDYRAGSRGRCVVGGSDHEVQTGGFRGVEQLNRVKAIYRSWGIPVNGSVGIVVAPGGRLRIVISCTVKAEKIAEMDVIAEPARLRKLNLRDLPD